MECDIKWLLVLDTWHLDAGKPRWAIHKCHCPAPNIHWGIYRAEDYTHWPLMKAIQAVNYTPALVFMSKACQSAVLTPVNDLPAHWKKHLSVTCCVGHQIQNLFVRFPLYNDAIDAYELISGPQTAFLLRRPLGNDGTDVDLMKLNG